MKAIDAIGHFETMQDRTWWPKPLDEHEDGPLALAAVASISGMLEDAETEDDLKEAVLHAMSLISSGIIPQEAWTEAWLELEAELMAWGAKVEESIAQLAELN